MKLILATHNPHKVIELKEKLKKHLSHIDVLSLDDLNITEDIEETESSFEGNAVLKAQWIADLTGELCIADDSGLCIEALNQEPGVYSARYLGENTPYAIKNQMLLERLASQPNRRAHYVSVVALAKKGRMPQTFKGEMWGNMALEAKGSNGFGYDPIFIADGFTQTIAEMSLELKNSISHRHKAIEAALKALIQEEIA